MSWDYPVAVPEVGLGRPAGSTALCRRRRRGLGGWSDVRSGFFTDEGMFLQALLVIPETANLTRCHSHAGAIPVI